MARNHEARQDRQAKSAEARAAHDEARQAILATASDARAAEVEARQAEARARGRGRGGGPERRGRRGREPLSRELIVDVAMRQMGSRGLDKLTMRSIASELDTGPASLYVHVHNTAELHGFLLDRILADVDLDGAGSTWRERTASILRQYYAVLMSHPEFARSALSVKPSGHHYLALIERLLALMAEGDVPPGQAAWGVDMLLLWATAGAAEHAVDGEGPPDPSQWDILRLAVAHPDTYPHVARVGLDLVSGTGEQRSLWSIDALLTGIAGTPRV